MYQISQFSRISGLTVKALRYYDKQNIIRPSYRDKDTLYRFYNDSDLHKAQLIRLLRSLDFSISEIRETMELVKSETDLTYILKEKIANIEEHIQEEKALVSRINDYLSPTPSIEAINTDYQITVEDIPSIYVASIRFTGQYSDIGKYVPILYKPVRSSVKGPLINCYYDEEYVEQANMELCLPVNKQIKDSTVECKYLPAVKAVCTTHYGSHEMLHCAYRALFCYVNDHKIKPVTPSREIYMKGPGMVFRGNPSHYITKIIMPLIIM